MKKAELVFIPLPAVGHLIPTVEFAKLLVHRDDRLSITVLIMKLPGEDVVVTSYTKSLSRDGTPRIHFVDLHAAQVDSPSDLTSKSSMTFLSAFIDSQRTHVKDIVVDIINTRSDSCQLAGFVIDMLCTAMIDVANEVGVPTYVFFTSSAAFLGLNLHLQSLRDDHNQDITEYKDSDFNLSVPSFANPVPAKVLPSVVLEREGSDIVLSSSKRLREIKGVIVNTFLELDSHAINALSDVKMVPTSIYSVGPVLNLKDGQTITHESDDTISIMRWLDDQPTSSVVFLCFGSLGRFDGEQVKEIAHALEHSRYRFLWSLRRPLREDGKTEFSMECVNPEEVLPEGFLERTAGIGKVIGWAPQAAVLSHRSTGGFVSHCGWNSTLESLWYGVPMATWPMYGEQQMNAFQMVVELGMAVEIKLDYRKDFFRMNSTSVTVTAEEIESGIRRLMDGESEIRKRVKEMKEKSRMGMREGGSSYTSLGRLIEDVINNVP